MTQDLTHAGIVAIFGMLVSLVPLGVAVAYMFRPTDRLLALMRPVSLATIFAALNTFLSGLAATFRRFSVGATPAGYDVDRITHSLAETITPMFLASGFLAAAWLCVAVGMRRQSS
jgi:hypothetical protein